MTKLKWSIISYCIYAAVGFGTVVANTEGFKMAIDVVTGIATTALVGISAYCGLGIADCFVVSFAI